MGIFDAFTGNASRNAAQQQRDYYTANYNRNQNTIANGQQQSVDAIGQGTAQSTNAITSGYDNARGSVNDYSTQAQNYLNSGQDATNNYVTNAGNSYNSLDALANRYSGATNLYMDSLGVNGDTGNSRAVDSFHAGPGYNFALDQGLDAINRRRAAGGMLASGNADRDATQYGMGLANQEYGNWQNRLQGFVNPELQATSTAATGRSGVNLAGAGFARDFANARAGVATNQGNRLSDLYSNEGNSLANTYNSNARSLSDLYQHGTDQYVNNSNNNAQAYGRTYADEAAAANQASGNFWSAVTGAATAGAGFYGRSQGWYNGGGGGGGGNRNSNAAYTGYNQTGGVFGGG